ncbi:MAG: GNAT family N-acetyltransferase [Planctomycetota bacterium]
MIDETKAGIVDADVEVVGLTAPLGREAAWEIESFLLKIFEYGDYSLRSALCGEYSKTLDCTVFAAKHKGALVGAAGCLYGRLNPAVAIVGPVGVAAEYRRNGIGRRLVESLIEHLRTCGCMAAYLGVSRDNPAGRLYEAIGFKHYHGIVMRYLMCPEMRFDRDYFGKCADARIRRAEWGDFPGFQGLISYPCRMFTADFHRGIFSSKYVEPTRFLSIFPDMMKACGIKRGFANVLVAGSEERVVGFANVNRPAGETCQQMAELDFYVHDNFIENAEFLVGTTVKEAIPSTAGQLNCYCLDCDKIKRSVIEGLGGVEVAAPVENAVLDGVHHDILAYQFKGDV